MAAVAWDIISAVLIVLLGLLGALIVLALIISLAETAYRQFTGRKRETRTTSIMKGTKDE